MANKYLAAFLSFLLPGLGQAYAGDIKKGIMYFVIASIVVIIVHYIFIDWYYYIVDWLISIYMAYDAYLLVE